MSNLSITSQFTFCTYGLRPFIAVTLLCAMACYTPSETVDCAKDPEHQLCQPLQVNSYDHEPRIYVDPPFGLSFSCLLLGCDETRTLRVENRGAGILAIADLSLLSQDNHDFDMRLTRLSDDGTSTDIPPPLPHQALELAQNEGLDITINYQPTDGIEDVALLKIDWFKGGTAYEEAVIEELELELSARFLSEATAAIAEDSLDFGYTQVGEEKSLSLEVTNTSAGEVILALHAAHIEQSIGAGLSIEPGFQGFANPGDTITVPVIYRPLSEELSTGTLILESNAAVESHEIYLAGTSISGPSLKLSDPATTFVDFGDIDYGTQAQRSFLVRNEGGQSAHFALSLLAGGAQGFSHTPNQAFFLEPLEETAITVDLLALQGGLLEDTLAISPTLSDAGANTPSLLVEMVATCSAPQAVASTNHLSFEPLVEGWVAPAQEVTINNSGQGILSINAAYFSSATMSPFTLGTPSPLPISLDSGQSTTFWVSNQALQEGLVEDTLVIESNGVDSSTLQVEVDVTVMSCAQGCLIDNGQPECGGGECTLAACDTGWHNTDIDLANGCECQEERGGMDVGSVCSGALDLGTLGDNCSNHPNQKIITGNLHDKDDRDLYFMRSDDAGDTFCDSFGDSSRTSVQLVSGPPGLVLCARIRDAETGCGGYTQNYDPSICGNTVYKHDGSYASNDDRDLTAWVMWHPDAEPLCAPYTLKFRGED
jgi:hypothetical protein